jgi:hypothetical protein
MLATFMQKWARRYIRITQPSRYSPHKRARVRAFFSDGVDKWHVSWTIEALPTLLHLSLFLFFAGLVIYLFSINLLVFSSVVWWVVLSMVAYLSITLLPIFWPNSPYYAPLSLPIWYLYGCIRYAFFKVLSSPVIGYFHLGTADHFRRLKDHYYNRFFEEIGRTADEDFAWKQASEIDVRVLQLTFDALDEAGAQEEFFGAIPGFFESKLVNGLKELLTDDFRTKFSEALNRFLDRTHTLNSVSESVRSRRLVICLDAAVAALCFDGVSQILWDILNGRWPELIQSVEIAQSLRHWNDKNDGRFTEYVQRIVAQVVVGVREHDYRWISLVKDEFVVPDRIFRSYIAQGDSMLLSILIHMTRQAFHSGSWTPWVLSSLSGFNIHDTLPELQHAFCAIWNDILFKARDLGEDNIYVNILREIRRPYIDLHRGTDVTPKFPPTTHFFDPVLVQPSSYRYCNIASHRQDLISLTVHMPSPRSAIIPSPTQPSALPSALPRPFPFGRHHTSSSSTGALEPSADNAPQEFTWPSPATDPMHISTQAPSSSGSSDGDSIRTAITWDPDRLIPGDAPHYPRRSAPSAAEIAPTNLVRSDNPTPQLHISESGESEETSQVPVAPPLIFQPVPAIFTPSPGPKPGDDPGPLQDITSSAALSHPLEGNERQDTVASCAALDISEVPSPVNVIPRSFPSIVVSDSSSQILLLSSGISTADTPSIVESPPIQPDPITHALRYPSLSLSIASSYDTHDPNPSIPMTVLHSDQTAPPAHDVVAATLQPGDEVQHDPNRL